jgi:predicted Zn-dependent peptidase
MKKISAFTAALLLLWANSLFSQTKKIDFVQYSLPNGLNVILHKNNTVPVVTVSVLYHVGSKDEDPTKTGFAHFFEHLMFEGSANIGRGEYTKFVENAGGTLNANTSVDRTFYFETLPSNQLELGLWLESERMMHAKIDKKGIETQREVVKEERRQRMDNTPYGSMLEKVMENAYKVHPYRWPTIGSMEHLNAAAEDDYVNFYKKFYIPNNATLSVAGDLDIEQTKKWIEKYFKDIPVGKKIERNYPKEPAQTEEVRKIVYDNVQLPAVIHAYKIPAQHQKEYYAASMLLKLLSEGESSRLNKSVKNDKQKCLFIGAFPYAMEHEPALSFTFAIANMGVSAEDLEAAMNEEYEKVIKEGFSEKELQKLRNNIESDFYSRGMSTASVAENLANYLVYFGDANLINTEIQRYLAVTAEDIKEAAKKILRKENRVTLYYLPKSQEK